MRSDWRIEVGDALTVLRGMPGESVQMCVTSPPYLGLRDYRIPPTIWGGDPACHHDFATQRLSTEVGKGNWSQGTNGRGELQPGGVDAKREPIRAAIQTGFCIHCSAWLGCLGLEPSPELFVEHSVELFREVRRILRKDGVLFLNIGDSYYNRGTVKGMTVNRLPMAGLKPKDLMGMPWRLALALQADGWWLRQDIIFSKPNPMPESVTDRCVKAHEYLFLLSKSQRYFFDAEAIKEDCVSDNQAGNKMHKGLTAYESVESVHRTKAGLVAYAAKTRHFEPIGKEGPGSRMHQDRDPSQGDARKTRKTKIPGGWDLGDGGHGTIHRGGRTAAAYQQAEFYTKRNKRSVWEIAPQGFKGAHFAVYPEKLVEPCVLAGTSAKGCCSKCGAPWKRATAKRFSRQKDVGTTKSIRGHKEQKPMDESSSWTDVPRGTIASATLGWEPSCNCGAEVVPCVVFDPFCGSGTTGVVALRYGRKFLGIELNSKYAVMSEERILADSPLFNGGGPPQPVLEGCNGKLNDGTTAGEPAD